MLSEVQYGTTRLDFSIKRSNRKTLAIEVHPDLSINVVSPYDISEEEIKQRVVKRANWIIKQQSFFEQFLPRTPEREYVSGETHFYLGRKYILKIRKSDEKSVKLMGGELRVKSLYKGDKEDVKRQLANWYFNHAQARFKQVLKESLTKFRKYNIEKPPLTIRRMKNRWGSCNPKGRIILNPEIIKTPSRCIEYVIIHELCHLVHPNHSRDFYQLQGEIMPDWERWKLRLEKVLV